MGRQADNSLSLFVPLILSILLLFVIPVRHLITIQLGIVEVGIANLLGILLTVSWCGNVISRAEARQPDTYHVFLLLFVTWASLSTLWSVNTSASARAFFDYFSFLVIGYIFWDVGRHVGTVKRWLQAYVAGQCLAVIGVLWNVINSQLYEAGRYSGLGQNPNILAVELAIGVPLAVLLILWTRERSERRLLQLAYAGFIALAVITILFTGSRQALLVLTATLAPITLYLFLRRPAAERALLIAGSCVLIVASMLVIPNKTLDRLYSIVNVLELLAKGGTPEKLVGTRIERVRNGIALFKSNPLLGVGAGGYPTAVLKNIGGELGGTASDSTFVSILSNLGLVGGIIFASILGSICRAIAGLRGATRSVLLGLFFGWITAAVANNHEYSIFTWFLFILIIIIGRTHSSYGQDAYKI